MAAKKTSKTPGPKGSKSTSKSSGKKK